jgi:predicted peptidase
VADDGVNTGTYTIVIQVADGAPSYALFQQNEGANVFTGTNGQKIPYNLYIPSNIQPGEKLPVVYALHGVGQVTQPVDMILKRYQLATVWAKDSAAGHNRAIVLAPQSTNNDYSNPAAIGAGTLNTGSTNWWTGTATGSLSVKGEAAFELLQKVIADNAAHVDMKRIYITGLSLGGAGTLGTLITHPNFFAAAIPICPLFEISDAQATLLKDIPFRFIHATDDSVAVANSIRGAAKLILAGGTTDVDTIIYPHNDYFYEYAHFSWVAGYQNTAVRDWLFAQRRASDGTP